MYKRKCINYNGRDYLNIAPKEQPPETLRQKDRKNNSGKRQVLTEGVILSGTNTDGVKLVLYENITINDLKINQTLYDFINKEVLPN